MKASPFAAFASFASSRLDDVHQGALFAMNWSIKDMN